MARCFLWRFARFAYVQDDLPYAVRRVSTAQKPFVFIPVDTSCCTRCHTDAKAADLLCVFIQHGKRYREIIALFGDMTQPALHFADRDQPLCASEIRIEEREISPWPVNGHLACDRIIPIHFRYGERFFQVWTAFST